MFQNEIEKRDIDFLQVLFLSLVEEKLGIAVQGCFALLIWGMDIYP